MMRGKRKACWEQYRGKLRSYTALNVRARPTPERGAPSGSVHHAYHNAEHSYGRYDGHACSAEHELRAYEAA